MKVVLIVEGNSDIILLKSQSQWFESKGLHIQLISTGGKSRMVKYARKYCRLALIPDVHSIIFLPDQNGDTCPLQTCQKLNIDSLNKAVTIVLIHELEAWILADRVCVNRIVDDNYHISGQTDDILDPKQKLFSMFHRKFGYTPSETESASLAAPCFSIERAARANTSANRFKQFIEAI